MNKIRKQKNILWLPVLMIIFGIVLIAEGFFGIYRTVRMVCKQYENAYADRCVDNMIGVIEDKRKNKETKDRAVWVLGQLGSESALPVLKKIKENQEIGISMYEVEKAIRWIENGSVTRWMYQNIR